MDFAPDEIWIHFLLSEFAMTCSTAYIIWSSKSLCIFNNQITSLFSLTFLFRTFLFEDKIFSWKEITVFLIFKWKWTEIEHIFFKKKKVKISMINGKKIKKLFKKFWGEIWDYLYSSQKKTKTNTDIHFVFYHHKNLSSYIYYLKDSSKSVP